ncbi:hypothetical protein TNCT_448461 [Trichonephila clavata]|uniref:Uncharacterized protein n=1 Tax=Trichonephila clavata TaxID=2740835 RepID=A0A8X6JYK5_TRICU|nr:hypothetical protein TNCT_448461 [Trichonephila clavata]
MIKVPPPSSKTFPLENHVLQRPINTASKLWNSLQTQYRAFIYQEKKRNGKLSNKCRVGMRQKQDTDPMHGRYLIGGIALLEE